MKDMLLSFSYLSRFGTVIHMSKYELSNSWFNDAARPNWEHIIPQLEPRKVLEIGSYEGASACWLIDRLKETDLLLVCIDTWEGGVEHSGVDMSEVERRFIKNVNLAREGSDRVEVRRMKQRSDLALVQLLHEGREGQFDFVYVDGSHQAPDVLADAVLAFRLLRPGGVIAFDDYLWHEGRPEEKDPILSPKLAIDSFTNIYARQLRFISMPLYQVYLQKL
jgi:predicted O-methyltransferase YrrM